MKKTSFVVAILASALLVGACGKKKDAANPTPPAGSDTGSAAGSGDATTPPPAPAAGSGS